MLNCNCIWKSSKFSKNDTGHANCSAIRFMMDFIRIEDIKEEHNKDSLQEKAVDNTKINYNCVVLDAK